MRLEYVDFDLVFHRDEAGSYSVVVSNSPVGEAAGRFEIPFSDQDLEIFLLRMGRARGATRRIDTPELKATRSFGSRLYRAAFGGRVGTLLERSLDEADRNEQGLRVRLHLAETPELGDLPWEFIYSEELGRFLATSTETPVVRYMDLPRRVRPLTIAPPLRILVMISSPTDHLTLDVAAEWRRLAASMRDLSQRGMVELSKVPDGSLQSLQQTLRRDEYHVLHFIGHGGFDKAIDDGVLILEDEHQRGRRVGGEDFGMMLHDHRSLRLVVLNACEGARSSRSDPFSGTGKSLIQQGIPAVVAMQFAISDDAAIEFARQFYEALADGYPVDAAMGEARKALFGRGGEWGTPVLYMRAPDGRIFDIETLAREADETKSEEKRPLDTHRLTHLLGMARTSIDARDWPISVSRLEDIIRMDPDHSEAQELLGTARTQERIARMYSGARLLFEALQWQAVVDRIEQIRLSEPDFDDPDQLERRARDTLAEEERTGRLAGWYRDATAAFEAGEWEVSIELLERIAAEDPEFVEAAGLLTEAKARFQSDQLLAEVGEAIDDERWQAAVDRFTEMEQLGADYVQDPHGWRQLVADRIAERQQEHRLDALYDTALALMEGEGWDEASRIIDKIESERPGYRGIDRFRTRINEAHARLVEEERLREIERDKEAQARLAAEERLREIEREKEAYARLPEEEGRLSEIERQKEEADARLEEEHLHEIDREPAFWKRRPQVLTIAIATVGALALLAAVVFFVIPGVFGAADGEDEVASARSPDEVAVSDDTEGLPPVVGDDTSDRVMAVYFAGWEDATTHDSCCDYWPLHPVDDWTDRDQLAQHFAWMRQARIGVIAYSWWGQGLGDDELLPAVLDAAERYGIEVAFFINQYEGRSAATLVDDVEYIYEEYGWHPAFHWVREPTRQQQNDDPKGLFLLRNSHRAGAGDADDVDSTYWEPAVTAIHNLRHRGVVLAEGIEPESIDAVGFDGVFGEEGPNASGFSWGGDLPDGAWFVPAMSPGWEQENRPGADAWMPRRGGETYDTLWDAALDTSVRPDRVLIETFNSWHQGTQIEPVAPAFTDDRGVTFKDYGDLGPEGYLTKTAEWVAEFLERFP